MQRITLTPEPAPTAEQAKDPKIAAAYAAYVEANNRYEGAHAQLMNVEGSRYGDVEAARTESYRTSHIKTATANEYRKLLGLSTY